MHDFRTQRLFVSHDLDASTITLDKPASHYLANVLRMKEGASVLLFNGRDGEWRATVSHAHKTATRLDVLSQAREQTPLPDIAYAFAPLKNARLDYMVQKAVEMGAARLSPVFTQHTQVSRVNVERMTANVREAAEQCGLLQLATVDEPQPLAAWTAAQAGRTILFCDERAEATPLASVTAASGPVSVLVGPEGGFAQAEREALLAAGAARVSLGPRILRADTAAVAALALAQIAHGDWGVGNRGEGAEAVPSP